MKEVTRVFKALSDANRVRILKLLELRPLCVCEIPVVLGLSVSTVSKHLSILRDADLILDKKSGKWVIYSLNKNSGSQLVDSIIAMLPGMLNDDESIVEAKKTLKDNLANISCNK